jgi:hypothetical protein
VNHANQRSIGGDYDHNADEYPMTWKPRFVRDLRENG